MRALLKVLIYHHDIKAYYVPFSFSQGITIGTIKQSDLGIRNIQSMFVFGLEDRK